MCIKDIHNSWLYCFTNPLEFGTRVSLSHRQPNVHIKISRLNQVFISIGPDSSRYRLTIIRNHPRCTLYQTHPKQKNPSIREMYQQKLVVRKLVFFFNL